MIRHIGDDEGIGVADGEVEGLDLAADGLLAACSAAARRLPPPPSRRPLAPCAVSETWKRYLPMAASMKSGRLRKGEADKCYVQHDSLSMLILRSCRRPA